MTAASATTAETLANIQASVGTTVDELVVNVSGLSGALTDHLESLETVGISYIGSDCERTEVAICFLNADPTLFSGFSLCSTSAVNIQLMVSFQVGSHYCICTNHKLLVHFSPQLLWFQVDAIVLCLHFSTRFLLFSKKLNV